MDKLIVAPCDADELVARLLRREHEVERAALASSRELRLKLQADADAAARFEECTTPGGATQWAAHTRQQRGQQPIYRPQTDVPNHLVKTQVAKQGFLIKSSGGKKDSVGTATGAF